MMLENSIRNLIKQEVNLGALLPLLSIDIDSSGFSAVSSLKK